MRKRLQKEARSVVRLSDVARHAGCSTATVSRALNTPELVSADVRERVIAAARELGYMPNSAARALSSGRTRMIGVVVPTLCNGIFARLAEALQKALAQHGYSLLVTTSDFDLTQEFRQASLLVERGVDGLVLVGHVHDEKLYDLLDGQKLPYVSTYTYRLDSDRPGVGFDNRQAVAQAADFLLDLGHREIGMIAGIRKDNDRAAERVEGAARALAARGLALRKDRVIEGPYTLDAGRNGLRRVLSTEPRPTALICGSDILAFGALIECEALGVAVPGELSIIGFDNLEFAAHLKPPLTTVDVPADDMGQRAAEYLVARLAGGPHVELPPLRTHLIVRGTTAPPRGVREGAAAVKPSRPVAARRAILEASA
jgi:LacI family transcriptional regulator